MKTIEQFISENKSENVYYKKIEEEITHKIPNISNQKSESAYSINNSVIIGITGSYGKSSVAYLAHKFLKSQGYRSALICSAEIDIPGTNYVKGCGLSRYFHDKKEVANLLYQAQQYEAEFVVLEINERSICSGALDDLKFSLKVLTSFKNNSNRHMDLEHYKNTKLSFFDSTPAVINAESENVLEFLQKATGEVFLYTQDNDYILSGENSINLAADLGKEINLYPTFKLGSIDNSYFEFKLNSENIKMKTTLSMNTGINMNLAAIAILSAINEFDIDAYSKFTEFTANVPGRCDDIQWNDRTFMFDTGNDEFIKRITNEIKSSEFINACNHYKNLYGEDFKTQEVKRIIGVFNIIGGINRNVLNSLYKDSTFKFLNPTDDSEPTTRKNFLIFGGNFYKLTHKLKENTLVNAKSNFVFEEVLNELGSDKYFLDFSKEKNFSDEYLLDVYDKLVKYSCKAITTKDEKYMKNFAWRSIVSLKAFFGLYHDLFEVFYEYFKSLGNEDLSNACDYISTVIEKTDKRYKEHCEVINETPIDKLYITINAANSSGTQYEFDRTVKNLTKEYTAVTDRLEALEKIVDESEPGDLILVGGRGNSQLYDSNGTGTSNYFISDKDYIERYCNLK